MHNSCKYIYRILLTSFFVAACSFTSLAKNGAVVARVGDRVISADEFIKSYSFGPSVLKENESSKLSYLNAMLNETLLAVKLSDENYKQSIDAEKQSRLIRQELLVEELFKQEVDSQITITEKEIYTEYEKNNTLVKLKYFFTKAQSSAELFLNRLEAGASFDYSAELVKSDNAGEVESGETDYLNISELSDNSMKIIQKLEAGEHSGIVQSEEGCFILQLENIKKLSMSNGEFDKYKSRYRKIIYNRKGDRIATEFVKKFMDSKEIVVKGESFGFLVNELYPVVSSDGKDNSGNTLQFIDYRKYETLPDTKLTATIVESTDGSLSLKELLYHLSYRPLDLSASNINEFAAKLEKRIGLVLRDVFMEKEAVTRGYTSSPVFKSELRKWTENILVHDYMNSMKNRIIRETGKGNRNGLVNKEAVTGLKKQLELMVAAQKRKTIVEIDTAVINSIDLDTSRSGRLPDVKLFKLGLSYFRLAFPTPAKIWGLN